MTLTQFIQKQDKEHKQYNNNVIKLLNEDNTLPFIARYRKEMTGNMDEVQLSQISKLKQSFEDLQSRKETILKAIDEQGKLTADLKQKIENCYDEAILEDYYLPYKKRRKTRADIAREKGLEALAKILMKQNAIVDVDELASRYLNDEVKSIKEAIEGAQDIMAEWINENEWLRNRLRKEFNFQAIISSKIINKKKEEEDAQKFAQYFDFSEKLKHSPAHRLLAILRGEKEDFLRVNVEIDKERD